MKKTSKIIYLVIGLFVILAAAIGGIAYSIGFDKETSNGKSALLDDYNAYMSQNDAESLEVHEEGSYIYSLYRTKDEDQIGILEFSKEVQNTAEVKDEGEVSFLAYDGEYGKYIGIEFNKTPEKVSHFKLILEGTEKGFDVNTHKDKEYRDSYLSKVNFDISKIQEVKVYDKDNSELYSKTLQ
jgi:hypothetical protein